MKVKKVFSQPPVGSRAAEVTALSVTKKLNPVAGEGRRQRRAKWGESKATGGYWRQMKANEGKKSFFATSSWVQGGGSDRPKRDEKTQSGCRRGPAPKAGQVGGKQGHWRLLEANEGK